MKTDAKKNAVPREQHDLSKKGGKKSAAIIATTARKENSAISAPIVTPSAHRLLERSKLFTIFRQVSANFAKGVYSLFLSLLRQIQRFLR